jgi:alcohol dehydrogenase class IV
MADKKLQRLAQAMSLSSGQDVAPALAAMSKKLGLPSGLAELSVTKDIYAHIITGALADHSHKTNPREASAAEYEMMLNESM